MRTELLETDAEWSGYLTLENHRAVADRIRRLLTGKRYTMVELLYAYTRGGQLPPMVKVHTAERIYPSWVEDFEGDKNDPIDAHIRDGIATVHVVGSQGWMIHTRKQDQSHVDMDALSLPPVDDERRSTRPVYLHFQGNQLDVTCFSPSGDRVFMVIKLEQPDPSHHCPCCGRDLWNLSAHDCPRGP